MRRALARVIAAVVAAFAFAAVAAFPAALGEGAREIAGSEYAPPLCAGIPCGPEAIAGASP